MYIRMYSFDVKNWRFFVLDSMRLSRVSKIKNERCTNESAYWLAKVKGKENGVVWGGGVDSEQLEWLENGLKKATQENKKVAVFCHMTIFPFTHASMFNHEQIAEIFQKHWDLIVRVWGWSGHFVELDRCYQDQVLSRTEYSRI